MTASQPTTPPADPFDAARVQRAPALLEAFNAGGVLAAGDTHVAAQLGRLGLGDQEGVLLAAALAARAPRLGHVCVDLATIRDTATVDVDAPVVPGELPWPEPHGWLEDVAANPAVAAGHEGPDDRPLRLVGTRLYLDRYWRHEQQVAVDLRTRSNAPIQDVDEGLLAAGLGRLFPERGPNDQRLAAATAVLHSFAVLAGGPGTGKTTTVARILALLDEQALPGAAWPRVGLAAPTGKAAARLEQAVRTEAATLDVDGRIRSRLGGLRGSTLHRLLGWRPDHRGRFRHHRRNRLPHDVVVVDETSMVSLSLMARLVEAVRPGARLLLVGDPHQLASVEAGAVLGDLVGPAASKPRLGTETLEVLGRVGAVEAPARSPSAEAAPAPVGSGIVVLRRVYRFEADSPIGALAAAVQAGDADAAVEVLGAGSADLRWLAVDGARPGDVVGPLREDLVTAGRAVHRAAAAGDAADALAALGSLRLLCAHRHGPYGVSTWNPRVEAWLSAEIDGFARDDQWYVGRPLLVTANDDALRLYNGDTGVVIDAGDGGVSAAFDKTGRAGESAGPFMVSPSRLAAVETVHAMTVHKSQGSQFDAIAVLLPDPLSPVLTRELLYTAVTRARERLTVVGTEAAVRAAVMRPIARASGLREELWGS